MYFFGKIEKVRISADNIDQFIIFDDRTKDPHYIQDRSFLEEKMINFQKGINDMPHYPGRYDLTVLTYDQYKDPYIIIDGCHRIEAMRKMLKESRIEYFDFWLKPSNILGVTTKEEAYKLNEMANKELFRVGLPLWVKKFEFCDINGKLVAFKNINIIDSGDINAPLQFGVDWKLNEGIYFADGKELNELPKYKDLIKKWQ